MRREMQLIVPGVYLGPFSAATKSQVNIMTLFWKWLFRC